MEYPTGRVYKIKRFSVHDGPGIRTAVFFKGCPLNCVWCHSPEGINNDITIWYNRNVCIFCGTCINSCPDSALDLIEVPEKSIHIDRNKCKLSGDCVRVCPSGAIQYTGYDTDVKHILKEVEKDLVFYESSGGGVTITGGEPLQQPEFLHAILTGCKSFGINTAIETSLFADRETLDYIYGITDLFLVDLKLYDRNLHLHYTGKENDRIKDNFRYLAEKGKEIIVRIPLIEKITDSETNISSLENFVKEINSSITIEKIIHNPLAENNYKRLGIPFLIK